MALLSKCLKDIRNFLTFLLEVFEKNETDFRCHVFLVEIEE